MDGEALMFFCSTDAGIVMGFNGRPDLHITTWWRFTMCRAALLEARVFGVCVDSTQNFLLFGRTRSRTSRPRERENRECEGEVSP